MISNALAALLLTVPAFCQDVQQIENAPETFKPLPGADQTARNDGGIVYFSTDNGSTWINASNGLPEETSIGLGGVSTESNRLGVATKEHGAYFYDFNNRVWIHVPADREMIAGNIGAMIVFKDHLYVGTQHGGVFSFDDRGRSWVKKNTGLESLAIRRFATIDGKLYAGTNSGLYSYDLALDKWHLEYGHNTLQVNGISGSGGTIYIATNLGAFKSEMPAKTWHKVIDGRSLHNISMVGKTVYAMTYNELLSSDNGGATWQNVQMGLPRDLYTFNVLTHAGNVFATQWDGVYRKSRPDESWKSSSHGLPSEFAATNLAVYEGTLVITTSERGLKESLTTDK